MGHNWSGWPGAYCTKCGCEHALENALALNWVDPSSGTLVWKSSEHMKIVSLCDENCSADMSPDDFKIIQEECNRLQNKIHA